MGVTGEGTEDIATRPEMEPVDVYTTRLSTRQALWPPKPKLFLRM